MKCIHGVGPLWGRAGPADAGPREELFPTETRLGGPGSLDLLQCPLWVVEMCSVYLGGLSHLLLLSLLEPPQMGERGGRLGPGPWCRRGLARSASAWSSGWPRPLRLYSLITCAL